VMGIRLIGYQSSSGQDGADANTVSASSNVTSLDSTTLRAPSSAILYAFLDSEYPTSLPMHALASNLLLLYAAGMPAKTLLPSMRRCATPGLMPLNASIGDMLPHFGG
jgi:hypothetical protein